MTVEAGPAPGASPRAGITITWPGSFITRRGYPRKTTSNGILTGIRR